MKTKTLTKFLYFFLGAFFMAFVFYLSPWTGADITYRENSIYFVQAYIQCFEHHIASWAIQYNVPLPLDSLEKEFLIHCGAQIDSIMTN